MDLRAIINVDNDGSAQRQASATPVTPVQRGPSQHLFREYHAQQPQASPGNHHAHSLDYGATSTPSPQASLSNHPQQQYYGQPQTAASMPFASPTTTYQRPPPPPPIQSQHEFRSPAGSYSAHSAHSAHSPYRQMLTFSLSNNQYPFPVNPAPPSPAQYHQYPSPHIQHHNSPRHNFPPASIPQTPTTPLGIPGSTHPYLQRSQSSLSASTPTSAHSQPPYFNQPTTPSVPMAETPNPRSSSSARELSLSVSPKTKPLKRKLEERDDSPQSSHSRQVSNAYTNGNSVRPSPNLENRVVNSARPSINGDTPPPPKRRRYSKIPIWAQSWPERKARHSHPNPQATATEQVQDVPNPLMSSNRASAQPEGRSMKATLSGVSPVDPIAKAVADFFYFNVVNRSDWGELDALNRSSGLVLEIEAKLGQVIDRTTNERLIDPKIGSQCILQGRNVSFRSNMNVEQHKALNEFLNEQVRKSLPRNPDARGRTEIKYKHVHQIDKFYEIPRNAVSSVIPNVLRQLSTSNFLPKVRVTHDKTTNQVQEKIIKGRLDDMSIFNPRSAFDCRISINYEINFDGDVNMLQGGDQQPDRYKDRLSYSQSYYQFDLTKVEKTIQGHKQEDIDYEMEIEVSTNAIREHGARLVNNRPNEYADIAMGLVDNIRILMDAVH